MFWDLVRTAGRRLVWGKFQVRGESNTLDVRGSGFSRGVECLVERRCEV